MNGSISKIHISLSPCVDFPATSKDLVISMIKIILRVTRTMEKNEFYIFFVNLFV